MSKQNSSAADQLTAGSSHKYYDYLIYNLQNWAFLEILIYIKENWSTFTQTYSTIYFLLFSQLY